MARSQGEVAVLVDDNLRALIAPSLGDRYEIHSTAKDAVVAVVDLDAACGLDMIHNLRSEHLLPVIALTSDVERSDVLGALAAGAAGCLTKDRIDVELADAVDAVQTGGTPLSPRVASHLVNALRDGTPIQRRPPTPPLTHAEHRVLEQLARGLTYEQVGLVLDISINTVRTRVRALYDKLGAMSRTEAVLTAARLGLIKIDA